MMGPQRHAVRRYSHSESGQGRREFGCIRIMRRWPHLWHCFLLEQKLGRHNRAFKNRLPSNGPFSCGPDVLAKGRKKSRSVCLSWTYSGKCPPGPNSWVLAVDSREDSFGQITELGHTSRVIRTSGAPRDSSRSLRSHWSPTHYG